MPAGVSRNHGSPPRLSEAELPVVTPPRSSACAARMVSAGSTCALPARRRAGVQTSAATQRDAVCEDHGLEASWTGAAVRGIERLLDGELAAVVQRFLAEHFEVSGR